MRVLCWPSAKVSNIVATSDRNEEIEEQIRMDEVELKKQQKLLLLGTTDSGKTTILKQFRILHDKMGFTQYEIHHQKFVIQSNIINSMLTIVQAMSQLGIGYHDPLLENSAMFLTSVSKDTELDFNDELRDAVAKLWGDPGVQQACGRSNEYQLNDSAAYFFEALNRVGQKDYVPTHADILHARVKTTGIVELKIAIDDIIFRIVDVGGQRSERKKWIHCFDDVSGVIFLASLSEYDQKLEDDESLKRTDESLRLFSSICNHDCFIKAAMILFLNKKDIFAEKLNKVPITLSFPEYSGPNTYVESADYIRKRYYELNTLKRKQIYSHITCATDIQSDQFCHQFHSGSDSQTQNGTVLLGLK